MKTASTLRKLMPHEVTVGKCACCGKRAALLYRDYANKAHFGQCCIGELLAAERELSRQHIRPPTPMEVEHFR